MMTNDINHDDVYCDVGKGCVMIRMRMMNDNDDDDKDQDTPMVIMINNDKKRS